MALAQPLAHHGKVVLLEVADPAVYEFGRPATGTRGYITLLDQGDAQAARRRVERHAHAGDTSADDEQVEGLCFQCVQMVVTRANHGASLLLTRTPTRV